MACTDHGKRITSIAHGATTLGQAIGGGVQESVTFVEDRPSVRKAPCLSVDQYGLTARAVFEDLVTPIVRGTKASLVYTLQQMDEGTMTVTLVNMVMGAAGFQFDSAPHNEFYDFTYDSGDTDVIAPITVA